jgi:hypothetical protein
VQECGLLRSKLQGLEYFKNTNVSPGDKLTFAKIYFAGPVGVVVGAGMLGFATPGAAGNWLAFDLVTEPPPWVVVVFPSVPGPLTADLGVESRQRMNKRPAAPQVICSRISLVFATPKIWLLDEKFEARPPPFEFCTSTIRMRTAQTMMIKIPNKPIFIFY